MMLRRTATTTSSLLGIKQSLRAAFFSTCAQTYQKSSSYSDTYHSLVKDVLKNEFNITKLTNLQQQVIETLKEKDSIAVNTLTNNGKTLSYTIPGLEYVVQAMREEANEKLPGFRFLVITNTRERALLIADQIQKLARHIDSSITVRTCTGGNSLEHEINYLDTVHPEIIVATPGRLTKHLQNSDYFNNVKLVVVDNAHKLSFSADALKEVFSQLPKQRKTISVSVNSDNSDISSIVFPDAEPQALINTTERELGTFDSIKYSYVNTTGANDFVGKLHTLLSQNRHKKIAIRVFSVAMCEYLMHVLGQNDIYIAPVHHNQPGGVRHSILEYINSTKNGILVGTEIIDNALPHKDFDMIITCEGEFTGAELLSSKLKTDGNSEFISFLMEPFGEKQTVEGATVKQIQPQQNLVPANEQILQQLYFSMLILKSKTAENKEQAVENVLSFVKEAGLEKVPSFNLTTARKYSIDKILKDKNLLGAL